MTKRTELTIQNVEGLGSERLASLLLSAAEGDPVLMRMLRVTVAARTDATSAASEIEAQIRGLRRGKAFIDRSKVSAFARDLSALAGAIEGPLAEADPAMALELLFGVIDLAPFLIERSDDSDGRLGEVFRDACESAAVLAARAAPALSHVRAAQRAYRTYLADGYGIADHIIGAFAKTLDVETRDRLKGTEGILVRVIAAT